MKPMFLLCKVLVAGMGLAVASLAQPIASDSRAWTPAAWPVGNLPRAIVPDAQPLHVDLELLGILEPGSLLVLNAGGAELSGTVELIERRSATSYSVFGHVEHDPDSFFILTVESDVAAGIIQTTQVGGTFRLGYVADGVHELSRTGPEEPGGCATKRGG